MAAVAAVAILGGGAVAGGWHLLADQRDPTRGRAGDITAEVHDCGIRWMPGGYEEYGQVYVRNRSTQEAGVRVLVDWKHGEPADTPVESYNDTPGRLAGIDGENGWYVSSDATVIGPDRPIGCGDLVNGVAVSVGAPDGD